MDTAAGPVRIENTPFGSLVQLGGLAIGDPGSPNAGLEVSGCFGVVLVDRCSVQGGAGQAGALAQGSPFVAIQKSDLSGTPGLRLEAGSNGVASRGSLDLLELAGSSTLERAQLPSATSVEPGSTLVELAGVMPDLDMPAFQTPGQVVGIDIETAPGAFWVLIFAPSVFWLDVPGSFEMVALVDPFFFLTLAQGLADPVTGLASLGLPLPANPDPPG